MHRKLVYRYYCDHCKKATCSAPATSRHERHCTMNPNRECRMCAAADETPVPLAELQAALRGDIAAAEAGEWGVDVVTLHRIEQLTNCPACMLAAMRQLPLPDGVTVQWSYAEARKSFWSEVNDEKALECHHG